MTAADLTINFPTDKFPVDADAHIAAMIAANVRTDLQGFKYSESVDGCSVGFAIAVGKAIREYHKANGPRSATANRDARIDRLSCTRDSTGRATPRRW